MEVDEDMSCCVEEDIWLIEEKLPPKTYPSEFGIIQKVVSVSDGTNSIRTILARAVDASVIDTNSLDFLDGFEDFWKEFIGATDGDGHWLGCVLVERSFRFVLLRKFDDVGGEEKPVVLGESITDRAIPEDEPSERKA